MDGLKAGYCLAICAALFMGLACAAPLAVNADALAADDPRIADGNDFVALSRAATKIPAKTEFETTAAYIERAGIEAAATRIGGVSVGGQLALRVGKASSDGFVAAAYYQYSPEKRTLQVCLPFAGIRYAATAQRVNSQAQAVRVAERVTPRGSYVGRNAFNVAVRVKRQDLFAVDVLVLVVGMNNCAAEKPMEAVEAQRLLSVATTVIVGHLEAPYITVSDAVEKATITDPVEEHAVVGELTFVADELLLVTPTAVVYRESAPLPRSPVARH